MKVDETAAQLIRLASEASAAGQINTAELASLILGLESPQKTASEVDAPQALRDIADRLVQASRPSRQELAMELRQLLARTVTAAGTAGPLKLKNRQFGTDVTKDDLVKALQSAAENYYNCRGFNRTLGDALQDGKEGYIVRLGPLAGMPDAVLDRADDVKAQMYKLDHEIGQVATSCEVLARDLDKAKPEKYASQAAPVPVEDAWKYRTPDDY